MNNISHMANVSGPLNVRLATIEALRMYNAAAVCTCMRWLRAEGFEIIKIEESGHMPRLYIRAAEACDKLEGAVRVYERDRHTERRYFMVTRHDCEVRWADHGGNA